MLLDGVDLSRESSMKLINSILSYGYALDTYKEIREVEDLRPIMEDLSVKLEQRGAEAHSPHHLLAAILTTGYVINTRAIETTAQLADIYNRFSKEVERRETFRKEILAPVASVLASAQVVNTRREEKIDEIVLIAENYIKLLEEDVKSPDDVAPAVLAGGYIMFTRDVEEEEIETTDLFKEAKGVLKGASIPPDRATLAAALSVAEYSTYPQDPDERHLEDMLRLFRSYAIHIESGTEGKPLDLLAALLSTVVLLGMRGTEDGRPVSKLELLVSYDRFRSVLEMLAYPEE